MAAYVGIWLFVYVLAFPLFVLHKLWSYREGQKKKERDEKRELVDLRFLLSDYKSVTPVLLWECFEIIRKLLLSVLGAFWSTKTTMAIATATVISAFFLGVHLNYHPFKSQ
jgi:hypothetical protein